jgi:hypothetical protein
MSANARHVSDTAKLKLLDLFAFDSPGEFVTEQAGRRHTKYQRRAIHHSGGSFHRRISNVKKS